MKEETMRQEASVHAALEEDEAQHGKVTRSMSSVRLIVDAMRADEQVGAAPSWAACLLRAGKSSTQLWAPRAGAGGGSRV